MATRRVFYCIGALLARAKGSIYENSGNGASAAAIVPIVNDDQRFHAFDGATIDVDLSKAITAADLNIGSASIDGWGWDQLGNDLPVPTGMAAATDLRLTTLGGVWPYGAMHGRLYLSLEDLAAGYDAISSSGGLPVSTYEDFEMALITTVRVDGGVMRRYIGFPLTGVSVVSGRVHGTLRSRDVGAFIAPISYDPTSLEDVDPAPVDLSFQMSGGGGAYVNTYQTWDGKIIDTRQTKTVFLNVKKALELGRLYAGALAGPKLPFWLGG